MKQKYRTFTLLSSDRWWTLGLLGVALLLYTDNLGQLPLRDWDEGIVAGVARNIWRAQPDSHVWLYPTINNSQPYWNKPPLIHWLIANSYRWWGVNEWSTRLPPGILSAISVPVLYKVGREIFARQTEAIFSALVYLTLLPMVRHGRLAMLDGAITCWFLLTVWCLLRSRYQPRSLLGVGLGLGLTCLTKGLMMGVLLGGILVIFLFWERPKLLWSGYFWGALVLGTIPAIAWYGLQYLHYGEQFLGVSLGEQTFNRIWQPVSNRSSPPWYYLIEIVKYTMPWLLFLPGGIRLAIRARHSSWAKLTLTWGVIYLIAVSMMVTKLPWYIIPIYPAFALLVGANLGKIWHFQRSVYSYFWKIWWIFLALISWVGSIYFGAFARPRNPDLQLILAIFAFTLTLTTIVIWQRSRYFIICLVTGLYLSLLLFFQSDYWIWELAEGYAVKPVAAELRKHTPFQQTIYTDASAIRPSLEFYSDRTIIPVSDPELKQRWQQNSPVYMLIELDTSDRLNLKPDRTLARGLNWRLITKIER